MKRSLGAMIKVSVTQSAQQTPWRESVSANLIRLLILPYFPNTRFLLMLRNLALLNHVDSQDILGSEAGSSSLLWQSSTPLSRDAPTTQ